MQRRTFLRLGLLTPLAMAVNRVCADTLSTAVANHAAPDGHAHDFALSKERFMLDGRPFQIRGGQMDPIRIPRAYWRHRIRMARAMGLNTIACYLMWNAIEPEPGHFDFTGGSRDYARFIELCAEEGMWVYVRPGPYVCAEWDFGGLPAWLLRDPKVQVRDGDNKPYMDAVARYFDAVAPRLASLMTDKGGPVLMLQLENEYASFGRDLAYLETLRTMWRERGIDGPFSISDGLSQVKKAGTCVPGAALGLDGGTDFAAAQVIAGEAPVWVGEGYTGWLSHWGDEDFQRSDYDATLRKLMDDGHSFNLYEVHGGTNFGFGAGANAHDDGSHFQADLTSYDYGAPIDERGVATDEYHRLRAIITGVSRQRPMPVPAPPPTAGFGTVMARPWASVWDNLPEPIHAGRPEANELLTGQLHGMVLYRRQVHADKPASLQVTGVHDYATVFVDGHLVGTISRVQGNGLPSADTLTLPASGQGPVQLDILVDSFGHVGFGRYMHDRKGLTGEVRLNGRLLENWQVHGLPLADEDIRGLKASAHAAARPGVFFRARVVPDKAGDNYIDMRDWDKGYVWVNGHLLGRYWRIGPQQRLYCPAEWWQPGVNEILVFDQHRTVATPIHSANTLHG